MIKLNEKAKQTSFFTEQTSYEIDYGDFEEYIKLCFELDEFEIVDCANDSTINCNVDGILTKYELEEIEDIIADKSVSDWGCRTLLNYLCEQGFIKPGQYYINVNW